MGLMLYWQRVATMLDALLFGQLTIGFTLSFFYVAQMDFDGSCVALISLDDLFVLPDGVFVHFHFILYEVLNLLVFFNAAPEAIL